MTIQAQEMLLNTGLSEETVRAAISRGQVVPIPEGWTPIHAAESATEVYFILEGEMRVISRTMVVAVLGPGTFAGEMGVVDRHLRSARVTVSQPAVALAWPRPEFDKLRAARADFDDLVPRIAERRHAENNARHT